jgi:hypothetical protein
MIEGSSKIKWYSLLNDPQNFFLLRTWLVSCLGLVIAILGAGCAFVNSPETDPPIKSSISVNNTQVVSQSTYISYDTREIKDISPTLNNNSLSAWTPTPLARSTLWEEDPFDDLTPGRLHGQNGWLANRASPLVTPDARGGNFLEVDAESRMTISIRKDVPDQESGYHSFEFEVLVTDATQPSLAKIEVQTWQRAGWDKKFQIYFGSSMRVSTSSRSPAATIIQTTQLGHWYHIRCEIDLSSDLLDVWVDKSLVASGLRMHPGPIVSLAISGWDRAGTVFLDNLLGAKMAPPFTVEITSPPQGATVSGMTPFRASASEGAEQVDFYVDGALQHTDHTSPFEYNWDASINPLPNPNHPMDFGYYFVEWKNPKDFDVARAEVDEYTNLYYASRSTYDSDLTTPEWRSLLAQSLADAQAEGKRIHLSLGEESLWENILDVAVPYWNSISRIEIKDEPHLSRTQTEAMIQRLKSELATRALPHRPMGFVYAYNEPLPDAIHAPSLDWVGIEAYLDHSGSSDSLAYVEVLNKYLTSTKAQVPPGKQIVLVMMAYDRNGNWTNIDTLRDLQIPVYMQAFNDPRVIAITMFSYSRAGGSRDHPELRTSHRLIGEGILGVSIPGSGNGQRTLTVQAFHSLGETATDRVTVNAQDPITPTYTPTPTWTPTPTPLPTRPVKSGLKIRGYVTRSPSVILGGGSGLADVKIYLQLGFSTGRVVATTDQHGFYESGFIYIPGTETVRVWAEKEGYVFSPDVHYWLHYPGYEECSLYFEVQPPDDPTATPIPTDSSESGIRIHGCVTQSPFLTCGGGWGVANAKIYLQLGSGKVHLAAITDPDGNYQSEFICVPLDEMISVWVEKEGYTFSPQRYVWQHSARYEEYKLNFEADSIIKPMPIPWLTPTPFISPSPTPTAQSGLWEDDGFDFLTIGPLHGQSGWQNGQASAQVIPFGGGGKVLEIDPNLGTTIKMSKNVVMQQSGVQRFEFDVMVNEATEPSLAKIEMRTNANAGWDKKFQLYFGSSMRVNYSPGGAAINIVPVTQMGHWYHIRCDMNFNSGRMYVWVDGANVAAGIPMHPGPIVGLSLSGWDRAGTVYLDNLLGSN